ncbi:hypothetical protein SAMN05421676_10779 [Salinibacillus kushneri]|uniref:PilX N-terminal n=1 Tax=Salinibacillus kushneri TaxID=237682 RepID=A0A1I0GPN7_9BACI|nr:hypothetical protein [Salinibacillus kushneri]SET72359.1 hypothetical protein SAMN05421676_10779 [Salinibacillus kushneri]
MKHIKNQKGYALVLAILAAAFISIIALTLIGSTISTANQTAHTESSYRVTDIAEIGVKYTRDQMNQYLKEHDLPSDNSPTYIKEYVREIFNHLNKKVNLDDDVPDRYFKIEIPETISPNTDLGETKVKFNITGNDGDKSETLTTTFTIRGIPKKDEDDKINWEGLFPDTKEEAKSWTIEEEWDLRNKEKREFYESVWIEGNADFHNKNAVKADKDMVINGIINTSGSESDINVCGNAKFGDDVNNINLRLTIGGHAYFTNPLSFSNNAHGSFQSGGSTYLANGFNQNKNGQQNNIYDYFKVGGNLLLEAGYEYQFDSKFQKNPVQVKGDLIIQNYDVKEDTHNLPDIIGQIELGGKVTDENGDKIKNHPYDMEELTTNDFAVNECPPVKDQPDDGNAGNQFTPQITDDDMNVQYE